LQFKEIKLIRWEIRIQSRQNLQKLLQGIFLHKDYVFSAENDKQNFKCAQPAHCQPFESFFNNFYLTPVTEMAHKTFLNTFLWGLGGGGLGHRGSE
jgi:hypothetical protein